MFWLIFIQCEYVPHVVCPCGGLHLLDDCFVYDEDDFPDEQLDLFGEDVLVCGDCEVVGEPVLRDWPVPDLWSNGEFRIWRR